MKLTDDVKQRKQKHLKQYRTAKQKLANKENLVRFLHRGKPETIHICLYFLCKSMAGTADASCVWPLRSPTISADFGYASSNNYPGPRNRVTNNCSVLSLAPEAGLNKKKWLVNRFIIFYVFVLGSLLNRDFLQYLLVMHAIWKILWRTTQHFLVSKTCFGIPDAILSCRNKLQQSYLYAI